MAISVNAGAKASIIRNMAVMLGGYSTSRYLDPQPLPIKRPGKNAFEQQLLNETGQSSGGGGTLASGTFNYGFSKSLQIYSGTMPTSASNLHTEVQYNNFVPVPTHFTDHASSLLYQRSWTSVGNPGLHTAESAIPVALTANGDVVKLGLNSAISATPSASGTASWWAITVFFNFYGTTFDDLLKSQINNPIVFMGEISDASTATGTMIVSDTNFVSGTINSINNLNITLF